jgi:hypothetical protein
MAHIRLDHPTRPVLIHLPIAMVEELDLTAQDAKISRSELIRRRLAKGQTVWLEVEPATTGPGTRLFDRDSRSSSEIAEAARTAAKETPP